MDSFWKKKNDCETLESCVREGGGGGVLIQRILPDVGYIQFGEQRPMSGVV